MPESDLITPGEMYQSRAVDGVTRRVSHVNGEAVFFEQFLGGFPIGFGTMHAVEFRLLSQEVAA